MTDVMTRAEAQHLDRCENIITRGMKTFIEVGNALSEIRDNQLYRASHGTFDAYCRDRWGWTSSRARQLIGAAETVTNVTAIGGAAPGTESQARELAGLTASQAAIVMRVAHERTNGNITAAAIKAARQQPWTDAEIKTAVDGYRIHCAAAEMPPFRATEWARFTESIGRNGLYMPITLTEDDQILDGRFRYLALRWCGIDPNTATTNDGGPLFKRFPADYPDYRGDELDFVISSNVIRQHLTDDQIAMIEVEVEAYLEQLRGDQ